MARARRTGRRDVPALEEHVRCRICGRRFKALNWSHLRYIHGIECSEYKRRFGVDYLCSDSCRQGMSERARRRRRSTYVPRDRAEIIKDVKALARRYSPLTCSTVMWVDPPLFRQVEHVFGNWTAAREAAGLGPPIQRRWTREDVVHEIRRRAAAGRGVNAATAQCDGDGLYAAGRARFGSWEKAVAASGLDYSRIRKCKDWSRDVIVRELKAWLSGRRMLVPTALLDHDSKLYSAVQRTFGSFENAARELRLRYGRRTWSKDDVTKAIRRRHARGQSLCLSAVTDDDIPLLGAANTHFGSWGKAVRASGFDYEAIRQKPFRTRENVARDLKAWVRAHGHLNMSDLDRADNALLQAARKKFGSLERAARLLGLPCHRKIRKWTPALVIKEIRKRSRARLPLDLSAARSDDSRLYHAAVTHFGSWKRAIGTAGLDYAQVRRR